MKYIIEVKRTTGIGMITRDYKAYIQCAIKCNPLYTELKHKSHPFDDETQAYDYIIENVGMDAQVKPITKEEYDRWRDYR